MVRLVTHKQSQKQQTQSQNNNKIEENESPKKNQQNSDDEDFIELQKQKLQKNSQKTPRKSSSIKNTPKKTSSKKNTPKKSIIKLQDTNNQNQEIVNDQNSKNNNNDNNQNHNNNLDKDSDLDGSVDEEETQFFQVKNFDFKNAQVIGVKEGIDGGKIVIFGNKNDIQYYNNPIYQNKFKKISEKELNENQQQLYQQFQKESESSQQVKIDSQILYEEECRDQMQQQIEQDQQLGLAIAIASQKEKELEQQEKEFNIIKNNNSNNNNSQINQQQDLLEKGNNKDNLLVIKQNETIIDYDSDNIQNKDNNQNQKQIQNEQIQIIPKKSYQENLKKVYSQTQMQNQQQNQQQQYQEQILTKNNQNKLQSNSNSESIMVIPPKKEEFIVKNQFIQQQESDDSDIIFIEKSSSKRKEDFTMSEQQKSNFVDYAQLKGNQQQQQKQLNIKKEQETNNLKRKKCDFIKDYKQKEEIYQQFCPQQLNFARSSNKKVKTKQEFVEQYDLISPLNSDEEEIQQVKQKLVKKMEYRIRGRSERKLYGSFEKDAPSHISKHKMNIEAYKKIRQSSANQQQTLKIQYQFYKVEFKNRPSGQSVLGCYYTYQELKRVCPRILLEYLEKMSLLLR